MGRDQSQSPSRSRSRSRSQKSDSEEDGFRIHVSDLGMHPEKREIERAFKKFGPIIEIWLARNPPCFAFIKYRHQSDGRAAIQNLHESELCGNRIRVSEARPRTRGRRPRGFDPNLRCYSCGETGHFSRDCNFHRRQFRTRSRERYRSRSPRSPSPRRRRSRSRSLKRRPRNDSRRSTSREGSRSKSRDKVASPERAPSRADSTRRSTSPI